MSFQVHDPYLNTVKRELDDKYYKNRREYINNKREQTESKSFLDKKINLSDFINLPKSMIDLFLLITFIFVPYITGLTSVFLLITNTNIDFFEKINTKDYFIYWSIGYEFLAFILMMFIIKSTIYFKKQDNFKHKI